MALTPAVAATLIKKGFNVNIEENAGVQAKFRNEDYEQIGAKLVNKETVFQSGNFRACNLLNTDVCLKVCFCCNFIGVFRYNFESTAAVRSGNR